MNAAPRQPLTFPSRIDGPGAAWLAPAQLADTAGAGGAEGVRTVSVASAASGLRDDEAVILRLKPHPVYVLLSSIGWGLTVAALGAPVYLLAQQPWSPVAPRAVALLAVGALCARLAWQTLDWWSKDYVLTDRRVIRVTGVLRRARFEAPLRNIQHVDLSQTVMERVFALGTLGFATSGTAFTEAHWLSVERPEATLRTVREAMDLYGRG